MPDAISDYFPAISKAVDEITARDTVDNWWLDTAAVGHFRCFGRTIKDITLLPFYEVAQISDALVHLFKVVDAIAQLVIGIFHNLFVADNQPTSSVDCSRHLIDIVDNLIASVLFPLVPIIQIFKDAFGIIAPASITMQKLADVSQQSSDPEHNSRALHKYNYEVLHSWLFQLRWCGQISISKADNLLRRHKELFNTSANLSQGQAFESSLDKLLKKRKDLTTYNDFKNSLEHFSPVINFLSTYVHPVPDPNPNANQKAQDLLARIVSDNWEQTKPEIAQIFATLPQDPTRVYESRVPSLSELAFRNILPIDALLNALRSNASGNHQQLLKKINELQWGLYFEKDETRNIYIARINSRVSHLDNVLLMLNLLVRKLDERFALQINNPFVPIDQLPNGPAVSQKICEVHLARAVNDQDIELLGQYYPNGLESLTFETAFGLTDAGLGRIHQHFPTLREIVLKSARRLSQEAMSNFIRDQAALTSFTFLGPVSTNPVQINAELESGRVVKFHYRGLQLGDEFIATQGIINGIAFQYYSNRPKPSSIVLTNCTYAFNPDIAHIACHQNTRRIEIRHSYPYWGQVITDQNIRAVADACPNLRGFVLENVPGYTNDALIYLVQRCQQLEEFEIGINYPQQFLHDQIITDETLDAIAAHGHNLKKLTLKYLNNVSAAAIVRVIESCPQLESLSLPGMHLSPEIFAAIERHLPRLKELDINRLSVNDLFNLTALVTALKTMLFQLKHLRVLNLNGVHVSVLLNIHKISHPLLRFYGVTRLEGIDDLMFRLKICRDLTTVSLVGNDALMSSKNLSILKAAYPGVTFILE